MSYQEDLDWLARNVHEWPAGHQGWCFVTTHASGAKGVSTHKLMRPEATEITIDVWLTRRAELQNKPSWSGAPEWAEWLAQDSDGGWWFYRLEPTTADQVWRGTDRLFANDGEVLGDWRDTLERRTADLSGAAVTKRLDEATWRERGELPPVGAFVDVTGDVVYGDGEKCCEVIAHVEDCAVIRMSWGLGCFMAKALSPHRTERDAAVEAMKAHCPYPGSWETTYRLFAEALYDAGYLKQSDAILAAGFRC